MLSKSQLTRYVLCTAGLLLLVGFTWWSDASREICEVGRPPQRMPHVVDEVVPLSVHSATTASPVAPNAIALVGHEDAISQPVAQCAAAGETARAGFVEFSPPTPKFTLAVKPDEAYTLSLQPPLRFAPDAKRELNSDLYIETASSAAGKSTVRSAEVGDLKEQAKKINRKFRLRDDVDEWYVPIEDGTYTPPQLARRERIRNCLRFYYSRLLNTTDDSPWSMMHHMIAWGADAQIWVGGYGGRQVNCIGWLCANGICEKERLLQVKNGTISARIGPGLQGHEGQFLAMLAQARVRPDQPIQVDGYDFTVHDIIDLEKATCRSNTELTFKLIGLAHYLDTDASWTNSDGEAWDIPRLIRDEIKQPINGVTCGGTHRLMGMSYAIRRRMQDGFPIDGQFARAAKYTADYREYAYDLRNPDGTFSTDFFRSRRDLGDKDRKLKTTGHVLEWIVFSSPHEELDDPRLLRAVDIVTRWLIENRYYDWDKGPLGHAIRALALFDERVYGGKPGERELRIAANPPRIKPRSDGPGDRPQAASEKPLGPPLRRGGFFFRRGR